MMKHRTSYIDLLAIFLVAFLSVILSFICIDIFFSILLWAMTGSLNVTCAEIEQVLFIGGVIGLFIGGACVIARYLGLKGF